MNKKYFKTVVILVLLSLVFMLSSCQKSAKTYTISFYDGETLLETLIIEKDKLPAPSIPKKEGFNFTHWSPEIELATSDKSYYANFEEAKVYYDLTFDIEGELVVIKHFEGEEIKFFVPTKQDYIFSAWYLDSEFKKLNIYDVMPGENITLYAQFRLAPGYKGNINSLINTREEYFPGLIVYKIDHVRSHFGGGTYSNIELHFPEPSKFDITYYTVEYFNEVTNEFEAFVYNDEVLKAEYNNLVLSLYKDYTFRLHGLSSDNKHIYSNTINTSTTNVLTNFSGWSLDQGMFISGIMMPYVGWGLDFSVSIHDISTNENILVEEGYSFEWYRLNPYTYELELIEAANEHEYITSKDDIGYFIVARVVGDEEIVGGYLQVISMSTVKQAIEALSFHKVERGCVISFDYHFDIDDNFSISAYDEDYNELAIDHIQSLNLGAAHYFQVDLQGVEKLYIYIDGNSFVLISSDDDNHIMQGFEVDLVN